MESFFDFTRWVLGSLLIFLLGSIVLIFIAMSFLGVQITRESPTTVYIQIGDRNRIEPQPAAQPIPQPVSVHLDVSARNGGELEKTVVPEATSTPEPSATTDEHSKVIEPEEYTEEYVEETVKVIDTRPVKRIYRRSSPEVEVYCTKEEVIVDESFFVIID
jgi:hypothetical protein